MKTDMMKNARRTDIRSNSAFTLVELLLVVVILGILAGVVVGNFVGRGPEAMEKAARTSISAICTAVDMYEMDTGLIPASIQNLIAKGSEPNWNGPYIRGAEPLDPWGNAFQLTSTGTTTYKVISGGPDGNIGGDDDITSF